MNIKSIHFTGIKGVGLTALALIAQDLNIKVTGSDLSETFVTDNILKSRNINWQTGFSTDHVPPKTDLLIYTAAHNGPDNPEVKFAQKQNINTLSYAQALPLFAQDKLTIATCGVGGKTTTAAMIATILDVANLNPSFAIGVGNIPSLGSPGKFNQKGKHFITEADEYFAAPGFDDTPKFNYLNPQIIAVTNIEYDHPDVYSSFSDTKKAYQHFFQKLPPTGLLVANADNPHTLKLSKTSGKKVVTYGTHPHSDFKITKVHTAAEKTLLTLSYQNVDSHYVLKVPGKFNALNAAAAIAVATFLGIDQATCAKALKTFTGTMRRFQNLGTKNNITVIDDYAHHPQEIKATLKAAKTWFEGRRLITVFQPHTYSRTKALFQEFSQSFADADQVIFLPIYSSAREKANPSVSSQKLAQATAKYHNNALYKPDSDLLPYLKKIQKHGDVILTLGAGDIFQLAKKLL